MTCTVQAHLPGCAALQGQRSRLRSPCAHLCRSQQHTSRAQSDSTERRAAWGKLTAAGLAAAALMLTSQPTYARQSLPPIDRDPKHCERAYVGNTIGQANAVADKILDLRKCDFKGADLSGKVLAGALLVDSDLSNTKLIETVLTKAVAYNSIWTGADLTNAVVDRVDFRNSDLSKAIFKNTVITGSVFEGAKLDGVIFEDSLIGREDVKKLCLNPSLQGEARQEVGCRN